MDLRVRAAHKRPLAGAAALEESDSGESERSQDDVWLPTPAASGVDSAEDESSGALSVSDVPESTSSTSESSGPRRVLAASPNKVEFLSWEAFDQYLAAYSAQTFQLVDSANQTFAVRITRCQLEHNHRLHENSFRAHSSNRVVLNDGALQTVDVLRRYGVKKTGIVRFITDKSISNPNAQDV
ncbi:hypothetical protein F444_17773 [Phytophthora nicotianae P1976]|uniref:Uncharacterized protein n=1 Tax=Phytophthora nicotianae P1976 TaxID=1317066 RepID=A0A080ZDR3_PHYNI|nr:hypothetical protein F444_17773 [Phytophthora nicotianae P1976]